MAKKKTAKKKPPMTLRWPAAKAMAAILDNPKAVSTKPQAAKVLISLLDKLQKASTTRRGKLAVVRTMTRKGDA